MIWVTGVPEGEDYKYGAEKGFENIMSENYLNLVKHINLNIQERSVNPKQDKPKEIHARQCIIKVLKTKGRKN